MSVVVGGGTGFIGSALVQQLARSGYRPVVVGRTARPEQPHVQFLTWKDLERQGELPKDCKAVINLAGANILNPFKRFPAYKKEVRDSRLKTTNFLAGLIDSARAKPDVWISSSAIGYYPVKPTVVYDETSDHGDTKDFLVQLVLDWEAAAQLKSPEVRSVVLRTGVVLGRTGGMIENVFMQFYTGAGGRIATGAQWLSWIHLADQVGIIMHALKNQKVSGVLNGTAPHPCTNGEFATAFGKALWRPAIIPTPEVVMETVFGSERAKIITEGGKVYPKRTMELGYKFKYPTIQEACKEFARFGYTEDETARQMGPAPKNTVPELDPFRVTETNR